MRFFFACQRDLLLKVILCCAELCIVVVLAWQTTASGRTIVVLARETRKKATLMLHWHGKPLCAAVSLLYWHGKPVKSYINVVLARQTSEKLCRCCTGTANHWKVALLFYWHSKPQHWTTLTKASTVLSQYKSLSKVSCSKNWPINFSMRPTLKYDLHCESAVLALIVMVQCSGLPCK